MAASTSPVSTAESADPPPRGALGPLDQGRLPPHQAEYDPPDDALESQAQAAAEGGGRDRPARGGEEAAAEHGGGTRNSTHAASRTSDERSSCRATARWLTSRPSPPGGRALAAQPGHEDEDRPTSTHAERCPASLGQGPVAPHRPSPRWPGEIAEVPRPIKKGRKSLMDGGAPASLGRRRGPSVGPASPGPRREPRLPSSPTKGRPGNCSSGTGLAR